MTRLLILAIGFGLLSACGQYREPEANCFDIVSRGPASLDCKFEPLVGPDIAGGVHD